MSLLSPRLQLKVAQKQILTPGLVQMVTVLQLNRLELKEMINQEMIANPVLEELPEDGPSLDEVQQKTEGEKPIEPAADRRTVVRSDELRPVGKAELRGIAARHE